MGERVDLITKTFFWDRFRGGLQGVIETGATGFGLIIAIRVFQAPDTVKSLIAAALPLGLFINPITLSLFSRLNVSASLIAGCISIASGLLMGIAALSDTLNGFLISACLAFCLSAQSMPMLVHVWTVNYPSNRRGAYLSASMMFAIASSLVFSLAGGWALDRDLSLYRQILSVIAVAYLLCGWVIMRIPSAPLNRKASENPIRNLSYAISDWKFGIMLLSWMFMGFGNLMLLPLRFEYLLQPEYGIEATNGQVVIITLVVTSIFRFATSRFWGALFDRINFMILRMILNALIMLSVLIFFTTHNLWVMGIAAMVLGSAMGGANISWSLWVTKFATPERTASYMSVHTFTTGIRGILSPFLGFYLIARLGATGTGLTGAVLIVISIVMVFLLFMSQREKVPLASSG